MCRAVVSLVLALCMQTAAADALLRNLEIQQCSDAELATWGDGKDTMAASGALTFSYRHAGSPRWLQENQVLGLLQPAQVTLATPAAQSSRSNIIIQWDAAGSDGQCFTRHPGLLKAFPEYRSSLPTACDIQRCRILNRIP